MPPGQAKKWGVGERLLRDLTYYDLPDNVVRALGVPPEGERYVRVGADILRISTSSGLVLDAMEGLAGGR